MLPKKAGATLLLLLLSWAALAQDFPKGWFIPIELGQGFTRPPGGPEFYLVSLAVAPQVTVIEGQLRLGITAGGFYNAAHVSGLAGPRVALKLSQGSSILTASSYNINLLGEFLWGTDQQQLPGLGLAIETSNLLALSLKLHRDINHNATWFQVGVAFNPFKKKFPEP